ncbi:MAG: alpha/beta hydrolase [Thermaurantiacus tibetensis]
MIRLLLVLLLAVPAAAEPWPLPGSEVVSIPAPELGRSYRYVVVLPPGYEKAPERRYPALFYTDAPQSTALIAGMVTRLSASGRGLEPAILVGLGYAEGDTGQYSRRRDYTPTPHGDIDAVSDMPGRPVVYGEAEAYRRHLETVALPELERRFRIDPARRIYLGHSYGGLFGVHVLLTKPEMFARYILISPSLWYDRRLMLARERGYASLNRDLPAKALFLVGSLETVEDPDPEPFGAALNAMVEDQGAFVAALKARRYPSLEVESRVLEGEDHGSVYVPAVRMGLEWALPGSGKPPRLPCPKDEPNCRYPRWDRLAPDR